MVQYSTMWHVRNAAYADVDRISTCTVQGTPRAGHHVALCEVVGGDGDAKTGSRATPHRYNVARLQAMPVLLSVGREPRLVNHVVNASQFCSTL